MDIYILDINVLDLFPCTRLFSLSPVKFCWIARTRHKFVRMYVYADFPLPPVRVHARTWVSISIWMLLILLLGLFLLAFSW